MAGLKNRERPPKRNSSQEPDIQEDPDETEDTSVALDNEADSSESDREITSESTRKRQLQQEIIKKRITEVQENNLVLLDLSRKSIQHIPEMLLECRSLQYLYLEGNELQALPEDFFDRLSNLSWLDLRNNYLSSIPTTYVSRHKCLKNMLLEGNQLRTLPLELGLVLTLHGLNIANNPLEFPPAEIIERGTQSILAFFREILKAKNEGRIPPVPRLEELQHHHHHHSLTDEVQSSDSEDLGPTSYSSTVSSATKTHMSKSSKGVRPMLSKDSVGSFYGSTEDLVGPVPTSAALHKPTSYQELRQGQLDKLQKAGVLKHKEKSAKSSKGRRKLAREVDMYPPPPDPTMVEQTYAEERRLAKLRDLKEKQELIIQRRKDADRLQRFRDESKKMQREKQHEKIRKGGKLDYDQPAELAPFGIEKGDLQMMTNEERIADIKAKHEKIRQRPLSPSSQKKMEEARAERDKELEKRIRKHTEAMQDRRRKPKGTPQQEMEAAMKELQVAEQLQQEIEARRKGLEYRFTAFTGEPIIPSKNRKSHILP